MRAALQPSCVARAAFLLAVALALTLLLVPAAGAQAPAPVVQAADLYGQGRFVDAVDLLQATLARGDAKGADVVALREMLARALVKVGRPADARATFLTILRDDREYRPDANKMPPDESAVFAAALRVFEADQRRVPASIGGTFGYARYEPAEINDAIRRFSAFGSSGGAKRIVGDRSFGGSVRLPLRPRLSIEIEMLRFRSAVSDSGRPSSSDQNPPIRYEVTALPLVASLYFETWSRPGLRVNAFGGLGPMFATRMKWTETYPTFGYDVGQRGDKTGYYGHLGLEGEYLATRRFALSVRVLGRLARASGVSPVPSSMASNPVGPPPVGGPTHADDPRTFEAKPIDFSGFGFDVGIRAYIGS